jgi:hypothetical protein
LAIADAGEASGTAGTMSGNIIHMTFMAVSEEWKLKRIGQDHEAGSWSQQVHWDTGGVEWTQS